jgi:hypothetical protein
MNDSDSAFLRRRFFQERELASTARCDEAREIHSRMASLYQTRLALHYIDETSRIDGHRPRFSAEDRVTKCMPE